MLNIIDLILLLVVLLFFHGPSSLNGTWKLTGVRYLKSRKVVNTAQTQAEPVILTFEDNGQTGKYNGKAMGENFGANYEIKKGNKLSISKRFTVADATTGANDNNEESIYELCDNSRFRVSSNRLTISCPGDTTEMIFEKTNTQ